MLQIAVSYHGNIDNNLFQHNFFFTLFVFFSSKNGNIFSVKLQIQYIFNRIQ